MRTTKKSSAHKASLAADVYSSQVLPPPGGPKPLSSRIFCTVGALTGMPNRRRVCASFFWPHPGECGAPHSSGYVAFPDMLNSGDVASAFSFAEAISATARRGELHISSCGSRSITCRRVSHAARARSRSRDSASAMHPGVLWTSAPSVDQRQRENGKPPEHMWSAGTRLRGAWRSGWLQFHIYGCFT